MDDEETQDLNEAIALIDRYWIGLAAVAFAGYQASGRGLIILDRYDHLKWLQQIGIKDLTAQHGGLPAFYVSGANILNAAGKWPDPEAGEFVDTYDPEQEIVFLISLRNARMVPATTGANISPIDAYKQLMGHLNIGAASPPDVH